MNSIQDIIYEKINDKYAYGQYLDFKVIIMIENGYINATKLCQLGGKLMADWNRLQQSKELINQLISDIGIPKKDLIITLKGGNDKNNQGTFVHPILIIYILQWLLLNNTDYINFLQLQFPNYYEIYKKLEIKKVKQINGFIYIKTDPIYIQHNIFKFGQTKDLKNRLNQYKTSHPDSYFLYNFEVNNMNFYEQLLQNKLKQYIIKNSEVFQLEQSKLEQILDQIFIKKKQKKKINYYQQHKQEIDKLLNFKPKQLNFIQ